MAVLSFLDKKDGLKHYFWVFEQLRADALAPREASSLIRKVVKELL